MITANFPHCALPKRLVKSSKHIILLLQRPLLTLCLSLAPDYYLANELPKLLLLKRGAWSIRSIDSTISFKKKKLKTFLFTKVYYA